MLWLALAGAGLGLGCYGIFCRLEGRQPIRELMYELRLRRTDLSEIDARAANTSRTDVLVGLTTIPSRLPYLVPTLKSLLLQEELPRRVLLHLPALSRREGVAYKVPPELEGLQVVSIVRCEDWGPATKILPALLTSDPDQRVVSVDDDRVYRPTFLGDLISASDRNPDAAVGCCGLRAPLDRVDRRPGLIGRTLAGLRFGRGVSLRGSRLRGALPVDVLHGYGGLLVRPRYFDLDVLADTES
ncbi:MAG: hypothetical protein ACKVIN_13930 [Longimicrobiales bacterium]